jgi:hypothetical protein
MQAFEANDLADIGFPESGAAVSFRLLQDAVVPRPVYLISTISKAGVGNVAPYSYISPAATTPTSFVLSILRRGGARDTVGQRRFGRSITRDCHRNKSVRRESDVPR